jgi:hypothetical protein
MPLKSFLFFTVLLFSPHAFATFLEVRGNAGGAFTDPKDYNSYLRSNGVKELYVYGIVGADAIIFPLPAPVGIGVRYEYFGTKTDAITKGNPNEGELVAEKWSALLTARIEQDTFYGGILVGFGFNHKSTVSVKNDSGVKTVYDDNKVNPTYSISFDSGLKLGPIRLGTEAGYQNYFIRDLKGSSGTAPFSIDLNGFYGMFHLGVGL